MKWYCFKPVDTLFFRSSHPMSMGTDHATKYHFPPPTQTIVGALRTAILKQNQISIDDYYADRVPKEVLDVIGRAGDEPNFSVVGPLFKKVDDLYVPAPYSWFVEKNRENKKNVEVFKLQVTKTSLITSSAGTIYWAKASKGELETLGGKWIPLSELQASTVSYADIDDFFSEEVRTGIALEKNRRVRKHHIYTFTHSRLKRDVDLVFGVTRDLPMRKKGILKLGAEQRFGFYQEMNGINFPIGNSRLFMSLSLVESSDVTHRSLVATGKIKYFGGWDMKKGFHKPMRGYFPPGSVFSQKLDVNFIEI